MVRIIRDVPEVRACESYRTRTHKNAWDMKTTTKNIHPRIGYIYIYIYIYIVFSAISLVSIRQYVVSWLGAS